MAHKIGENIRKYRLNKGLSVDDLSRQTGFASNYLGALERGQTEGHENPKVKTLAAIAAALDVTLVDIFRGTFGEEMAGDPPAAEPSPKLDKQTAKLFEIIENMAPEDRERAVKILKAAFPDSSPASKTQKKMSRMSDKVG